ncbi:MAG TPA: M48 family metallopeptidase [Burkholderiaceae bacterium]|nr:M48 family metallopeptidase [Burkholderiaceae bacterium]
MNRRGFLRWGCAHCALLYATVADAQGAPSSSSWTPPPRFAPPDAGSDEGGLWATMAREEQRLRRSPFLIRDDKLRDYLQGILCRLAGQHCPDVRVYPVRNANFNANMAPNGMMQIWSGLLLRMDNEAQLAAVVGHEIGHFLQRHSLERLRDAKSKSAASVVMLPFGLFGLVGQLALLASVYAYSREQEREADTISVRLMSAAGYDSSQASDVWDNLLAELKARPNADAATSSVLFASHPPSDERRDTLRTLGKAEGVKAEQAYREQMVAWQIEFLEDEIKRGQYPETIALLDRKLTLEPQRPDLLYARAEARRLRAQDKDVDQALVDLKAATATPDAPAQAHRSLGLMLRERKDAAGATAAFRRYLEVAPEAPDAGLIKTYLSELQT